MGTRADFYIGRGLNATWIGSVAWDGYEWAVDDNSDLMNSRCKGDFLSAVSTIADKRDDFTSPEEGWPWPWNTSETTDYIYYFADGKPGYETSTSIEWPDMTDVQNVQMNSMKSGVIVVSS